MPNWLRCGKVVESETERGDWIEGGEGKEGRVGEGVGGRPLTLEEMGLGEKEGWRRPSKLALRSTSREG